MLIKRISLKNIRSYTEVDIEFPEGSTLLSGDIGSGKSTIFHAIEFALFGLIRGELHGETLLRKGATNGLVRIEFECNNLIYKIQRQLKSSSNKVSQVAGYIEHNGVRKDATAIEIKSKVLEILNYPPELLNKKSLIYRYAVYTPQEEMKRILFDSKEERLDTLRKIFNIDKYKKIKNNLAIYLKELRDKKNRYEGETHDIDEKKKELENINEQMEKVNQETTLLLPQKTLCVSNVEIWTKKVNQLEEQVQIQNKNKHAIDLNRIQVEAKENQIKDIRESENDVLRNIEENRNLMHEIDISKPQSEELIDAVEKKIKELEEKIMQVSAQQRECSSMIINHQKEIKQVVELDNCPLCKQSVTHEHKSEIKSKHEMRIEEYKIKQEEHDEKITKLNILLKDLKEKLRSHSQNIQEYNIKKNKYENLVKNIEQLNIQISSNKNKAEEINSEIAKLNKEYLDLKELRYDENLAKKLVSAKAELEKHKTYLRDVELELAKNEQIVKQNNIFINKLENEIKRKQELAEKTKIIKKYQLWLQDYFIPLQDLLEKSVFTKIHQRFSEVFQSWFRDLIDDENLDVRLDEDFTAMAIQNGHDIEIKDLSGGEKTAVALAYRLALNNVINNFFLNMNTKDIIMLDEPTDGFSSSQLDKMREVLEQLGLKQVLIVSHENKIESFVDNVIKIRKDNHVSEIV